MNEHEIERKKLWIDAAIAIAGCESTVNKSVVVEWADYIMEAFDKRFHEGEK